MARSSASAPAPIGRLPDAYCRGTARQFAISTATMSSSLDLNLLPFGKPFTVLKGRRLRLAVFSGPALGRGLLFLVLPRETLVIRPLPRLPAEASAVARGTASSRDVRP